MCGITGYWGNSGAELAVVERMSFCLQHRGPDGYGAWMDASSGVALAHRRLSIIDPSPTGSQPMISPCGRYVLVYNGEIYNHINLRKDLEEAGAALLWRGHSDTETLLAGLAYWGVEGCLRRLNGMFAFSLWDRKHRKLFLARDRFGEKPLYFGHLENSFVFGSELKALAIHPKWRGEIDRDAVAMFMRYNHVPAPHTIYHGIKKLLPAHYLVISNQGRTVSDPITYWSLEDVAHQQIARREGGTDQLEDELDYLLRDAVGLRMNSDVPLGAFLSGGYDSTMIVAQMQNQSSHAVRTFSIGNKGEMDEATYAANIARHLGTDHTELYVSANDALSVIPRLPHIYDEPFADSSQIPTFLVSQLARRDVTVALSGDGGDELFAGYNRHISGVKLWPIINKLPLALRQTISFGLVGLDALGDDALTAFIAKRAEVTGLTLKMAKLRSALFAKSSFDFYDLLKAHWKSSNLVLGSSNLDGFCAAPCLKGEDFLDQMLFMDMQTYLSDDILQKVDRASMSVGLEVRVPLLDHRLVEFAWRIPLEHKVRNGKGKFLFREVLSRYVPRELMDRPKQGFGIPIAEWLRGPLREWGESMLDPKRLYEDGFLNVEQVRLSWDRVIAGKSYEEHNIWCVLMFQAWLGNRNADLKST